MLFDEIIPPKLYDWLLKQEKQKMLEIMFEALDLMQGYNGRSIAFCIFTAGGFTETEEGKWKFPKEKPVILPLKNCNGMYVQYKLNPCLSHVEISDKLGFQPNVEDDPDKVIYSWAGTINGKEFGIWDYKGIRWSVFDPHGVVKELFTE